MRKPIVRVAEAVSAVAMLAGIVMLGALIASSLHGESFYDAVLKTVRQASGFPLFLAFITLAGAVLRLPSGRVMDKVKIALLVVAAIAWWTVSYFVQGPVDPEML